MGEGQYGDCAWRRDQEDVGMIEIFLGRLALSLLPVVMVAWISWRWAGRSAELGIATARMVVQLLAVGYVLLLFFKAENP